MAPLAVEHVGVVTCAALERVGASSPVQRYRAAEGGGIQRVVAGAAGKTRGFDRGEVDWPGQPRDRRNRKVGAGQREVGVFLNDEGIHVSDDAGINQAAVHPSLT